MLSAERWDWWLFATFSLLWALYNLQFIRRARAVLSKNKTEAQMQKDGWKNADKEQRVKGWKDCTSAHSIEHAAGSVCR